MRPAGWITAAAAIFLAAVAAAAENPERDGVLGFWETENGKSRVQIHECEGGERICGTLVWSRKGSGKYLGSRILSDFAYEDGRWEDGRIVDPRDGDSYRAKLELEEGDLLKVRGCWFIFCGGQTWKRIPSERVQSEHRLPTDEDEG